MISTNRYICVAAAAVYGGRAMELVERRQATGTQPDATEQTKDEQAVAQYMREHASQAPTTRDIGISSHAVFTWEQMTFGDANAKAGWNQAKAFFGRGRALTDAERGVVGSAIWFASEFNTKPGLDKALQAACLHVVHELRDPTKWDNASTKKIKQIGKKINFLGFFHESLKNRKNRNVFSRDIWKKHHCRLTGKVVDHDEIGELTGVKLSNKKNKFGGSTEDYVKTIFEHVGFQPMQVKQVMSGEGTIDIESKIGMLTKVIEHDTFLESAVSRQLLEDVLGDQQDNRPIESSRSQDRAFDTLKSKLIGTPIYHFLVEHKFTGLKAATPTGADQWPPCLLVKPEQAGVDAGEVKKASEAIAADKAGWKRSAILRFFARAAKLLDRGYSVYRFHGTPATFNFTHEKNGVVRAKSKALWFSAEVQGSTDPAFVQMSESSLVQGTEGWLVGITATVGGSIYIYCLVLALMYCHPGGIVMLVVTAVAALVVAAIQYSDKTSLKSDVVALKQQVADLKSDKQHLKDFIDTIPHLAKITYRDGADGTDLGEHHVLAVTRNGQRQENTARTQAVAVVAQKLSEPDYGTETELPDQQKALVKSLESTFGNLEFTEKQTLASALYRNGAQNAGELVASLNGEFNTF